MTDLELAERLEASRLNGERVARRVASLSVELDRAEAVKPEENLWAMMFEIEAITARVVRRRQERRQAEGAKGSRGDRR